MVASSLCASILDGPPQPLWVIHRSMAACQLADAEGIVRACAVTAAGIRLPHAVVLPTLPAGPRLTAGSGRLRWDTHSYPVARWWRPARPQLPTLLPQLRGRSLDTVVHRWLGRVGAGPGLTPYADDVLCGMLVALRAAGHWHAERWSAAVRATPLERSTTATSAALLRLAADGWCIGPVADYLTALATGSGVHTAERELRQVGHSSGRGLLAGITAVVGDRALGAAA